MLLNPGTVLGNRYEIVEKIGSGGMAVVYRGKDLKLDRYVTVKVLREEYIGDEEFIARFRSEACAAARLSHPNIVRVYDVGEDDEINYIVMEYIHGDTLKTAIKKKAPFDSRSTINVAIQIASALAQAHKAHIIHRDIKPQNILVGTDGVVKVTDFGIARAARATTMTTTANAAGSVHYFSPEQARGGYVDEKSDIYSLGITMFEMITGVLPFQGNNSVAIALKHINEELPDIKQYNPKCSPSLEGIIKKATMKKADERYANIDLMLADLVRARTELTFALGSDKKPESTNGVRMSKRAEAAMGLRAAQEKVDADRADRRRRIARMELEQTEKQAPEETLLQSPLQQQQNQSQDAVDFDGATKKADAQEIDLIRLRKNQETPKAEETPQNMQPIQQTQQEDEDTLHKPLVSFERYGKKLKISKEDQYEGEYMAAEEVRQSRRPERKRRNPRKEEGYDNERDRKAERKVIIAAVLTALVIIGLITTFGLRALGGLNGFGSGEKDIATPTFVGMTYEQAIQEAERAGLTLVKEGEDYSNYYDKNYIFWQDVEPDTMVANKTKIGVKVSLGLTEQEMPNVENHSQKDAEDKIIDLVGVTPDITYEESDEVKAGYVISQTPAEGTKITANTKITLVVSKGTEGSEVVVPDVEGDTESSAIQSLNAVGLTVGSVTKIESDTVAEGLVIRQTLAANEKVPEGSVVNLVISSGPPKQEEVPEETPNTQPEENPEQGTNNDTETTQPEQTQPEQTQPEQTQPETPSTSTKYFTIQAPEGAGESVHVQVIKTDANGTTTEVDTTKNLSDFPFSIAVTGTGSGTVTGYVDGNIVLTEAVEF